MEDGAVIHDFMIGLYFSVSTFTTLGYGDFVPTPETRVVASVEALSGYVLLGLIVASAFGNSCPTDRAVAADMEGWG